MGISHSARPGIFDGPVTLTARGGRMVITLKKEFEKVVKA